MNTQRNILMAFLLNLSFSVFELAGGIFTGSIAIISDAFHDMGDAAGIGISWFLEKKSKSRVTNATSSLPLFKYIQAAYRGSWKKTATADIPRNTWFIS